MSKWNKYIASELEGRAEQSAERTLKVLSDDLIDFSSNDYLGVAKEVVDSQLFDGLRFGASGSRLLSGNNKMVEALEGFLSEFYKAESGLLFSSGYAANVGVLQSILTRDSIVLFDEACHASIRDGISLSNAKSYKFKHNDLNDLKRLLGKYLQQKVLVVVESVYSMDGDKVDLKALVALKDEFDFEIVLDEAHAIGLFGSKGEGLAVECGVEQSIFIRVCAFGKAVGVNGAMVFCSDLIRRFLINNARSFIYSTGVNFLTVKLIEIAHDKMSKNISNKLLISSLSGLFKGMVNGFIPELELVGDGPIFGVVIPGNAACRQVAEAIQKDGFDVRPILSPTVKEGKERLRVIIHSYNTFKEIEDLSVSLNMAFRALPKA